ncbi:MAG: hypothetical protein KGQ79_06715 [Proteobacteria bacterium]|nr:hypothetical protein [Pseudomonadota bacterium]
MKDRSNTLRRKLLLFTACSIAGAGLTYHIAEAQTATSAPLVVIPGDGNNVTNADSTYEIQKSASGIRKIF